MAPPILAGSFLSYTRLQRVQPQSTVCLSRTRVEASLRCGRFEQFDGIAGRIFDYDLLATNACDYIVSKVSSRLTQHLDDSNEVADFNRESVPPPRNLVGPIGHWLSAPACRIRRMSTR